MITDQYYCLVYTVIVFICAMLTISQYSNGRLQQEGPIESLRKSLPFLIVIILFIGFRPNSTLFSDGPGYWASMEDHRYEENPPQSLTSDVIFHYFMAGMSSIGVYPRGCFVILAIVVYGFAFLAMRKIFPNHTLLAFAMFCGAFGTFGFAVNGIRNGCAMSLFLCALAYVENKKIFIPFLILAFGFHHSMELSIAAFICCSFYKNTKMYYIIWVFCFICAALHITTFQTFFAGFTDEHAAEYLITDSESWVSGFRLDFILYSCAPLVIGWWVIFKKQVESEFYTFVLNVYLLMNSIWMLCMYAAYTNRIAQLSWSLFPILLLYPFLHLDLSNKQMKTMKLVVFGQLAFTLFMSLKH